MPTSVSMTGASELIAATARAIAAPNANTNAVLDELANGAKRVFEADDVAILLLGGRGMPSAIAATSNDAQREESAQVRAGAGPCIEAIQADAPVRIDDSSQTSHRWPDWTEEGLDRIYRSVLAAPFAFEGRSVGTLNLA